MIESALIQKHNTLSMKKFIAPIILIVIFTSSFATKAKDKTELKSPKIQTAHNDEAPKVNNVSGKKDYFGTLRKSNSSSKNILGIGENKQDSHSTDTEICSVAANTGDGKSGAGLCGVPADKSDKELKNKPNDEPS